MDAWTDKINCFKEERMIEMKDYLEKFKIESIRVHRLFLKKRDLWKNKTGTSKVGAISKAQKSVFKLVKGGTLSAFWKSCLLQNIKKIEGDNKKIRKFFWKNEKWEFWNSRTVPKTREWGHFGLFENSVCCKISEKLEGGTVWRQKKIRKKKSHSAEKNSKGGPCSPVRFCILR